jgi:phage terminase large subunit-like protein
MKNLRPWLLKAGFSEEQIEAIFVEFGQGFQSMSPALRDTEAALLAGKVRHGNHPVLTMCAANAVVTTDPAGGRKLSKAKSATRIDGLVALCMAFGVAPNEAEAVPSYEMLVI